MHLCSLFLSKSFDNKLRPIVQFFVLFVALKKNHLWHTIVQRYVIEKSPRKNLVNCGTIKY